MFYRPAQLSDCILTEMLVLNVSGGTCVKNTTCALITLPPVAIHSRMIASGPDYRSHGQLTATRSHSE